MKGTHVSSSVLTFAEVSQLDQSCLSVRWRQQWDPDHLTPTCQLILCLGCCLWSSRYELVFWLYDSNCCMFSYYSWELLIAQGCLLVILYCQGVAWELGHRKSLIEVWNINDRLKWIHKRSRKEHPSVRRRKKSLSAMVSLWDFPSFYYFNNYFILFLKLGIFQFLSNCYKFTIFEIYSFWGRKRCRTVYNS